MMSSPNTQSPSPLPLRILIVKLADLGDVLTITPALRALRLSYPAARIDALVTPTGAAVLTGLDSVDELIPFNKAWFDTPSPRIAPLARAFRLASRLRRSRYSHVFLFHHLFTGFGRLKYAALLSTTGAPFRGGIAEGHPVYLTHVVPDRGYGVLHEADYWLEVVGLAGARNPCPAFEIAIDDAARERATSLLGADSAARRIAFYPGSGPYSVARRWPVERYRQVAARLGEELGPGGCEIVILGTEREAILGEALVAGLDLPVRDLAGKTDLKTAAAVLSRCELLIGNDGGVMHLARAVGTPVVAVFGPSNHVSWGPYGATEWSGRRNDFARSVVVRSDLPCAPCLYRGYLPGAPEGCQSRDCLRLVESESVVRAALDLMDHKR